MSFNLSERLRISCTARKALYDRQGRLSRSSGNESISCHVPFILVILAWIAVLVTVYNYPLFLGMQFMFGMSVALAALSLKRGLWGFFIAMPAVIATCYVWRAPCVRIPFMAGIEVLKLIMK